MYITTTRQFLNPPRRLIFLSSRFTFKSTCLGYIVLVTYIELCLQHLMIDFIKLYRYGTHIQGQARAATSAVESPEGRQQ